MEQMKNQNLESSVDVPRNGVAYSYVMQMEREELPPSFVAGKTHILGVKCGGTLEKVSEFQLYVEGSGFGSPEARVLVLFLKMTFSVLFCPTGT